MNTVTDLIARATDLSRAAGGGWLPPDAVKTLTAEMNAPVEQLMLELIPLASTFARPTVSGFQVGAVGQGVSGAIYFGANLEFKSCPLNQTVHAEQAVVANAAAHRESGLVALAISATPCGYCRQFLYELVAGPNLRILLPQQPPQTLSQLLPGAFGPSHLGLKGGLLGPSDAPLEWPGDPPSDLAAAAFAAAQASYAPYTGALAGLALMTEHGKIYSGSYLENAAFNPSVSPLQAAMVAVMFGSLSDDLITAAAVVEVDDSKINHARAARLVLEDLAPGLVVSEFRVRRCRSPKVNQPDNP